MEQKITRVGSRSARLERAIALQALEGNPLTPDEIAMFDMFEREGWSSDQRRAYILAELSGDADRPLAAE